MPAFRRPHGRLVEAEPGQHAGAESLDEHVGRSASSSALAR